MQWQCWSKALTSSKSYTNAYEEQTVTVTFKKTGSTTTFTSLAAWNGGGSNPATASKAKFLIRAAFPLSGDWTWTSKCMKGDDPCTGETGLTKSTPQTVSVSVQPPGQTNFLYTKGHLKQSSAMISFGGAVPPAGEIRYWNGEPFFWLADSAWAAPMRACLSDWQSYIDTRAGEGFTAVQIGIAPAWLGDCTIDSLAPFDDPPVGEPGNEDYIPGQTVCGGVWPEDGGEIGCAHPALPEAMAGAEGIVYPTDISRPNLPFWSRFEKMVQYANSRGLAVVVAGVANPVGYKDKFPIAENLKPFARFLAASLAGHVVIFSPGFDDKVTEDRALLFDSVGAEIRKSVPRHLITNHYGTSDGVNDEPGHEGAIEGMSRLHTKSWLGFHLFQSSYNCNDVDRITHRPFVLPQAARGFDTAWDELFADRKIPVINGEPVYEQGGDDVQDHRSRFRVRQAVYTSWLSGTIGATLGVGGVWDWGACGTAGVDLDPDTTGIQYGEYCMKVDAQGTENDGFLGGYRSVAQGKVQPISGDMKHLKTRLDDYDFAKWIANEQSRITNNPTEVSVDFKTKRMTVVRASSQFLVYLPHNPQVKINVAPYEASVDIAGAKFYVAETGAIELGTTCGLSGTIVTCTHAADGDAAFSSDALLVLPFKAPSLAPPPGGCTYYYCQPPPGPLEFLAGAPDAASPGGLYVRDASSSIPGTRGPWYQVAQEGLDPNQATAAKMASGSSYAVWVASQPGESFIQARTISSTGFPTGATVDLGASTEAFSKGPRVAFSPSGFGLGAWLEFRRDSETPRVVARALTSSGSPMSFPLLEFSESTGDEIGLGCTQPGCLLAWTRLADAEERVALEAVWVGFVGYPRLDSLVIDLDPAWGGDLRIEGVSVGASYATVVWERLSGGESAGRVARDVYSNGSTGTLQYLPSY